MNSIEYERTKAKLELFEQRGMNWLLKDLNITEQHMKYLKRRYKFHIQMYETKNKENVLKQTEIKFKSNE